ncbi:MAG: enoyl-CoA hydratase/isomerase family protein [Novosphingobium sp.]|nr:enoyl-CoA hydratase/isomerase family protein [Novosphingobium sp.]
MEQGTVLVEIANGIATLTLNRPDRGNAWNQAMSREYLGALDAAARSPDVRAIIVTGAGKAFCTGGDGEVLGGVASKGGVGDGDRVNSGGLTDHLLALRVGKPVIGAINGACFGIGMQQALCCDMRIGSEDAKFSTAFARRAVAGEMGITWLLPRLVGTGNAMDLLLSARLVRAPEAEKIGLVNRVVPAADLMAEARATAAEMVAKCAPSSMRTIKAQVWSDLGRGLQEAYDRASELMDAAFASDDFKEGIASWQEGRAPHFPALSGDDALI